MIKKCLMITIYLVLGYQAKGFYFIEPMMERAPASFKELASTETKKVKKEKPAPKKMKNICSIQAGDIGKLKYKGKTYEQAFSKVTDECFQRRSAMYQKSRKQFPSQDRQIQFAEACVNAVKCI